MTEEEQIQAIADGLQGAANEASAAGLHLAAGRISAGLQLVRALWTRVGAQAVPPPPDSPETQDAAV